MSETRSERYAILLGALYQTVSAIVHQNQHPTSDGDAHDAALLDILSDPDRMPLEKAQERLAAVADFYWCKGGAHVTASVDALPAGRPPQEVTESDNGS